MKFKFIICFVFLLSLGLYVMAQPDPPPDGGTGEELDSVPLAGGLLYFILSLIVGATTLLKKKKGQSL